MFMLHGVVYGGMVHLWWHSGMAHGGLVYGAWWYGGTVYAWWYGVRQMIISRLPSLSRS